MVNFQYVHNFKLLVYYFNGTVQTIDRNLQKQYHWGCFHLSASLFFANYLAKRI